MGKLRKRIKKKDYLVKLCLTIAVFVCIPLIVTQLWMLQRATIGYSEIKEEFIIENVKIGTESFDELTKEILTKIYKVGQDLIIKKAAKETCTEYALYEAALKIDEYSDEIWTAGVWFDNIEKILYNTYHKDLEQFCANIAGDDEQCKSDIQRFILTSKPNKMISTANYSDKENHIIIIAKRVSFLSSTEKDATVFFVADQRKLEKKIAEQIYESSSVALIDVSGNFVLRGSDFPEELCKSEGFQNYLLNSNDGKYIIQENGEKRTVYKYQGKNSGYTCLVSTYVGNIEKHIQQYVDNIRNITIVSIVLMCGLLVPTIRITYKPIKELANRHGDRMKRDELSELEVLEEAIFAADQKVNDQKNLLKEFLISDLLNGKQVDEKMLQENFPNWEHSNCVVVALKGQMIDSSQAKEIAIYINRSIVCDCYFTSITYRPQLLMVCIFKNSIEKEEFYGQLLNIFRAVLKESPPLCIGSIVNNLTEIRKSYLSTLIEINCLDNIRDKADELGREINKFTESIYAGDSVEICRHLDVLESMLVPNIIGEETRRYNCYRLLNAYFDVQEITHSEKEIERLIGFKDVNHLFVMLRQSVRCLCAQMKDDEQKTAKRLGEKLVEYVDTNFNDENISLATTADYLGTSIYVISRLFKEVTGRGFKDYISEKRLNYARELLQTTTDSVSEIASKVGFMETSYFSGLFKAKFGISPMQYRKKYKS